MTIKAQTGPGGTNEHPLSSLSNSETIIRTCECCGEEKADPDTWLLTDEGDFCPDCADSLKAELERQIAKLPKRIGLCPQCAEEFYYPLRDDEGLRCPSSHCGLEMIVYERTER